MRQTLWPIARDGDACHVAMLAANVTHQNRIFCITCSARGTVRSGKRALPGAHVRDSAGRDGGLMSTAGAKAPFFERRPITSGLPPNSGHSQRPSACFEAPRTRKYQAAQNSDVLAAGLATSCQERSRIKVASM
jgi:hypothetical protein